MNAVAMAVATESLPASRKIYLNGVLHPSVRVPMRQIELHPSAHEAPLSVYDASGPYTDPEVRIDIAQGLPRVRERWIQARGDSDPYPGRKVTMLDNGVAGGEPVAPEFPNLQVPRRARGGAAVTQ